MPTVILSNAGEARTNGYLYVLQRSLRSFLPQEVAADAVREIESHLRDRISAATPTPDERAALERILAELGPPLRVAQAYSTERVIEEAVTTGRFVPTLRAVWHLAVTTVTGFVTAVAIFLGYVSSFAFFAVALLKPIFPNNVGIQFVHGIPVGLAAIFPDASHADLRGGYWVVPIGVIVGLAIFTGTHRGARRFLASMRRRREEEIDARLVG